MSIEVGRRLYEHAFAATSEARKKATVAIEQYNEAASIASENLSRMHRSPMGYNNNIHQFINLIEQRTEEEVKAAWDNFRLYPFHHETEKSIASSHREHLVLNFFAQGFTHAEKSDLLGFFGHKTGHALRSDKLNHLFEKTLNGGFKSEKVKKNEKLLKEIARLEAESNDHKKKLHAVPPPISTVSRFLRDSITANEREIAEIHTQMKVQRGRELLSQSLTQAKLDGLPHWTMSQEFSLSDLIEKFLNLNRLIELAPKVPRFGYDRTQHRFRLFDTSYSCPSLDPYETRKHFVTHSIREFVTKNFGKSEDSEAFVAYLLHKAKAGYESGNFKKLQHLAAKISTEGCIKTEDEKTAARMKLLRKQPKETQDALYRLSQLKKQPLQLEAFKEIIQGVKEGYLDLSLIKPELFLGEFPTPEFTNFKDDLEHSVTLIRRQWGHLPQCRIPLIEDLPDYFAPLPDELLKSIFSWIPESKLPNQFTVSQRFKRLALTELYDKERKNYRQPIEIFNDKVFANAGKQSLLLKEIAALSHSPKGLSDIRIFQVNGNAQLTSFFQQNVYHIDCFFPVGSKQFDQLSKEELITKLSYNFEVMKVTSNLLKPLLMTLQGDKKVIDSLETFYWELTSFLGFMEKELIQDSIQDSVFECCRQFDSKIEAIIKALEKGTFTIDKNRFEGLQCKLFAHGDNLEMISDAPTYFKGILNSFMLCKIRSSSLLLYLRSAPPCITKALAGAQALLNFGRSRANKQPITVQDLEPLFKFNLLLHIADLNRMGATELHSFSGRTAFEYYKSFGMVRAFEFLNVSCSGLERLLAYREFVMVLLENKQKRAGGEVLCEMVKQFSNEPEALSDALEKIIDKCSNDPTLLTPEQAILLRNMDPELAELQVQLFLNATDLRKILTEAPISQALEKKLEDFIGA